MTYLPLGIKQLITATVHLIPVGTRDRDLLVVGLTATYAIGSYQQSTFEFESRSWRFVLDITCDLRHVGGFFQCTPVSFTNKTDRHDTTEIFLKVVLNTITLTHLKCKSWLRFVLLVSTFSICEFVHFLFLFTMVLSVFVLICVVFHHACHGTF